ncbi:MAG: glycosyltransferase family 4 protein [Prevotella sp.]|nr:glycosyltransferase family 4 protein [Prevotella sp.]
MKTIGFDAKRIVRNGTGLGSYSRTLVNSLSALPADLQLRLYTPDMGRDDLRQQIEMRPGVEFVYPANIPLQSKGLIARVRRDWWRTRGIVKDLQRDGISIYHGLSGELPVGLKQADIKGIVTIHDLIFLRHPEYYHPWDVAIYRHKFHATLREAARVVAISECTKRDILAFGDFPADHIDLIYQSCGTSFKDVCSEEKKLEVKKHYNLPQRYILNVGTIEERKNAFLAVKALRHLPQDVALVIVGRTTPYSEKVIKPYIRKNKLEGRVILLHGIPNDDLPAIYQLAECFVYPSRYEGFGIPIIEAVQSQLPVVAATGSCLEEAGGPDNLYVSPDDEAGMATAILRSMKGTEGRQQRIDRSIRYVQRFENSNVAQQMLDLYNHL